MTVSDTSERPAASGPFLGNRRVSGTLWPVAAFATLALILTWPIARDPARLMTAPALGDPVLNAWTLAWGADRALHGFAGFWTGLFYYPYPDAVAFSEHLLGITLFTAPVQWISGNPVLAYNVALIGATFLAGWGMYLLARELTGRADAAVIAGIAFAALPYRVAAVSHLQVLTSGWMPLSLWALHCYLATSRRSMLALFAAAFVLQAWSNGYFLYFLSLPASLIVAHALWADRANRARRLRDLSAAAGGILLALAPVAAAYVRLRRNTGFSRTLEDIEQYSAPLEAYTHVSDRLWLWGDVLPRGLHEMELFAGLTIVILAGIAWLAARPGRHPATRDSRSHGTIALYTTILVAAIVLSLGPHPRVLGWQLPFEGPYGWLLHVVPGLSGLRVPARLAMVAYLALGVLAAFGCAALTRGRGPRARGVAAAVCAIAVAVEGYGGPVPTQRFPTREMSADVPAYDWLRDQAPGPVLELPVGGTAEATRYMYRTLLHGHRIVNGYSGSGSAMQQLLGGPAFNELDQLGEALLASRAIGLRYILVHPTMYGDARQGWALVDAARREVTHVEHVVTHGAASVIVLKPLATHPPAIEPAWRPITRTAFHAAASHNGPRLDLAFDGDTQSRWLTGQRQQGREWIEIGFDSEQDLARVRLDLDRRSRADYPRGLVVELVAGDGSTTRIPVHAFELLARSVAADPLHAGIDILLPPNRTRTLRLRITGQTRLWFWSVDELRFFARQ